MSSHNVADTICCKTLADLIKTVFDLLVSVSIFVGRFDMRTMQVNFYY